MPVPLAITAPATVAALAYLNARSSFWYDMKLLNSSLTAAYRVLSRERSGRLNMFYVLEAHALSASRAAHPLLWFEGRSYSYADVYDTVLRYGAWLRKTHGVRPGDVVAMDMVNSEQFIFVWWALWSIGAKPAFLNYNLTGSPLTHCVRVAGAKLCLVDPDVAANVSEDVQRELPEVQFVLLTPAVLAEALSTAPVRRPDQDRTENDLASMSLLIYTSGTTGMPKPAVVSWGRCIVGSTIAQKLLGRGGDDIMYTSMPLYHSSAALLSMGATVIAGTTQALGRKFTTRVFWDEVRASNATMIQYVGETLRYLLAAPPQHDPVTGACLDRQHRVRLAFGNGLRPDVWNRFKDRFGIGTIAEFYAATESPIGVWNVSANDLAAGAMGRHGWIHQALARRTAAVVEVDWTNDAGASPWRDPTTGFCRRVRTGDPGELLARLEPDDPNRRYQGYYGNADASRAKVIRDVFSKGDMFFRTGDVVRRSADGLFFFHDRIGDTFRWKSENVSTAEVSQAVGSHRAVREANVYGVQLPHHDGRAGCAAVWLDADDADTMRSLGAHVRAALPPYARPLFLRVRCGVEHGGAQITGTNKQQKQALQQAGVRPVAAAAATAAGKRAGAGAWEGSQGVEDMGALYWLRGDAYVPFGLGEWRELDAGRVKL